MIKRFKESGKTILVTTHNIETIVNIADRILLVSKNKISLDQTINTQIDSQQIATIYKKLNNELS